MKKIIGSLIISGIMLAVLASVTARAAVKVADYKIDAAFYPDESRMFAHTRVLFVQPATSGDTVNFWLGSELQVDSILIDGSSVEIRQKKVPFSYSYTLVADEVEFVPNREASEIDVYYSGYFHKSKTRSPSDYMRIDSDGVFLRSYGYSLWFPVFVPDGGDMYHVDFSEVRINVPRPLVPVFVGEHVSDRVEGDRMISLWRANQISLHGAQCTARPYERTVRGDAVAFHLADSGSSVAARFIAEEADKLNRQFADMYRHDAQASNVFIIQMPRYGDIASANVVGVQEWDKFSRESWNYATLAHELVHAFVDVQVSRNDSLAALMIEGFPSFYDAWGLREILGNDWYDESMKQVETEYLKKKETGLSRRNQKLPTEIPIIEIDADKIGSYKDVFILSDRASLFLNYLLVMMGDERSDAFIDRLFNLGQMDCARFRGLIEEFLPGSTEDVHVWLETNEYPERFHLAAIAR